MIPEATDKPANSKVIPIAPPTDRAKIIDEYGELDRKVQEFEPLRKQHEKLKSVIKYWYVDAAPEATPIAQGKLYEIQVGACERARTWKSIPAVVRAVGGIQAFYGICSVAIGAVENIIGKSKTAALLAETQSGSRRIKAVPKSVPQEAA